MLVYHRKSPFQLKYCPVTARKALLHLQLPRLPVLSCMITVSQFLEAALARWLIGFRRLNTGGGGVNDGKTWFIYPPPVLTGVP